MYKVLIVDDEPLVRKRLRTIIPWEEHGFFIVGEAEDGEEALKLFRTVRPHVIFTDIRMPVINGLELIKMISGECGGSMPQIVILSEYNDFEYAKEAMKYGIKNYLLKPTDVDELVPLLHAIKTEVEDRLQKERSIARGNMALREKWAADVLFKRPGSADIGEKCAEIGIHTDDKTFGVLCIQLDNLENLLVNEKEEELQENLSIIRELIQEAAPASIVVEESLDLFVLLLMLDDQSNHSGATRDIAENIRKASGRYTGITVTIGIGSQVKEPAHLPGCYKEAKAALEAKFFMGMNKVYHLSDLVRSGQSDSWDIIFGWDKGSLHQCIENNDHPAIREQVDRLFGIIREKGVGVRLFKDIIVENLMEIGRIVKKMEGDIHQIVGEEFHVDEQLKRYQTLQEYEKWFLEFCINTAEYMEKLRKNRPRKVSKTVVDHIHEHYSEDITLKKIAKIVYMNPVYLGQVFKNDVGKSFNEYLTEVRIKEAVKLLTGTDMNVYEIAEKIGYEAPGNFYKAFKKYMGCSPVDYRSK